MTHTKIPRSQVDLPINAQELVPHRSPMLFVDLLVERKGDFAKSQAVMPESGICLDSGRLLPEFFVELIAQTSAMANGYDCLVAGGTLKDGMLVGVDSFKIHNLGVPGEKLLIDAEKKLAFGPITLIQGKIWAGDLLLAEGEIKVWENPDEES